MKKVTTVILIIVVLLVLAIVGALYAGYTITNGSTNLSRRCTCGKAYPRADEKGA